MLAKIRKSVEENLPVLASAASATLASIIAVLSEVLLELSVAVQATGSTAFVVGSAVVGSVLGKLAQRHTWSESSHAEAVARALQMTADQWREALMDLGLTLEQARSLGLTESDQD